MSGAAHLAPMFDNACAFMASWAASAPGGFDCDAGNHSVESTADPPKTRRGKPGIPSTSNPFSIVHEQRLCWSDTMRRLTLLVVLVSSLFAGCRGQTASTPRPKGVIRSAGHYDLGADVGTLEIEVNREGIVVYRLIQPNGATALESTNRASAYQRWFLWWDEQARQLWYYSSDIGTFVSIPDDAGNFREISINSANDNVPEIPAPVLDAMPRSARKALNL
jgi:hypothetical protein